MRQRRAGGLRPFNPPGFVIPDARQTGPADSVAGQRLADASSISSRNRQRLSRWYESKRCASNVAATQNREAAVAAAFSRSASRSLSDGRLRCFSPSASDSSTTIVPYASLRSSMAKSALGSSSDCPNRSGAAAAVFAVGRHHPVCPYGLPHRPQSPSPERFCQPAETGGHISRHQRACCPSDRND